MKKLTNKILLGTGILILVGGTILMFHIKTIISEYQEYQTGQSEEKLEEMFDSQLVTRNFDFNNFDEIDLYTSGYITISQGEKYSISIEAPQELIDTETLEVKQKNDALEIFSPSRNPSDNKGKIQVDIKMPDITRLNLNKNITVNLEKFDLEDISVQMAGECELFARQNTIENLSLRCFGSSTAKFKDSKVTNAEINGFGSSFINITMAGGVLEGSIIGSGDLIYYGEVEKEDINTVGSTKVRKNR